MPVSVTFTLNSPLGLCSTVGDASMLKFFQLRWQSTVSVFAFTTWTAPVFFE
jgi:hypothetical protein